MEDERKVREPTGRFASGLNPSRGSEKIMLNQGAKAR